MSIKKNIIENNLFDQEWYVQQCPYISDLNIDPLDHYLSLGHLLGYEPFKGFSKLNIDKNTGENPLELILSNGALLNSVRSNHRATNLCLVSAGIMGPTSAGGVAKCTVNLIELVDDINRSGDENRINLTVLYVAHPYYNKENFQYWKDYFESKYKGVIFEGLDEIEKSYGSNFMKRSFNILKYFENTIINYDSIIFHDFQGIAYFSALAKKSGTMFSDTKLIVNTHGNHRLSNYFGKKIPEDHNDLITMFMEAKSVEMADYVISPSKFYLDWWSDYASIDKNRSLVLNNITKPEVDFEISPSSEKKYSISFFGRLEILKGVDLFVSALLFMNDNKDNDSRYREFLDNVDINFIGNSVKIYGQKSEEFILNKCKPIEDKVNIVTGLNTKEAFEYMRERDSIMILPTLGETSSMVVSESICNGVHFLASDIDGIKELVHEDFHESNLFECGNMYSLIDKLLNLVQKPVFGDFSRPMDDTIAEWESVLLGNHELFSDGDIRSNAFNNVEDKCLVSVVVPTYQRYDELEESLSSIVTQTYKSIEIIVVDDGSADSNRNRAISEKYGAQYVESDKKLFKAAACNLGASRSKGKYVLFFDDDDILHSDSVECYVRFLESNPDVDVCSGFCSVFDNAKYENTKVLESEYVSLALGNFYSGNILSNYFGKGSFVVRKGRYLEIGGYDEDLDNTHMVDYRFYVKASTSGLNIHVIPRSMYFYRKNSNGSLYYENANNAMKIFNAKNVVLDSIKTKVSPDLYDMIELLYLNHSYPRVAKKVDQKDSMKWLSRSCESLKVVFSTKEKSPRNIKVYSSDKSLLCDLMYKPEESEVKIKGGSGEEGKISVERSGCLDPNSSYFTFTIINDKLEVANSDMSLKHELSISSLKNKNIRKIIANTEFMVA